MTNVLVLLNDEDLKYYVKNFSSKFVALEEYMESGDWEKNFIPFKIDIALTDKPVTVIPNGGEILQELKRQGNNLNQAVRRCYFYPSEKEEVLSAAFECTNGEEGMNEHGLVAAMTFAVPKLAEIKPGLNSVFLVRYLLEKCRTVDEGISAIQRLPVSSNCNILIADKTGRMVVVECNPFEKHVRIPQVNEYGNKFIITVNELLSSEMAIHKASQGDTFFSKERYATAENALLKLKDNPIDNAKSILSGKCGFMCQYAKELNFDTVWATIFNLSDLKIYRAEGNPNKKSFVSDDRLM